MTRKIIRLAFLLLWVAGLLPQLQVQGQSTTKSEIPNFKYIDNYDSGITNWWTPEGSGSTAGIILKNEEGDSVTYRAPETVIVNPATGSTTSLKLAIQWDNQKPWTGLASHLVRQHLPAGVANTAPFRFQPGQALEVFVYGDGSGNRLRLMTRDGIPTLEGSPWIIIDWTGWKRITWDYNIADNVIGWVNGDGKMDGINYYFDSFQVTKDEAGLAQSTVLYFDDLRIVDPFNVKFNIAGKTGQEEISINNITYQGMQTGFVFSPQTFTGVDEVKLFPGKYQYFVKREGAITQTGIMEVIDQDIEIGVNLVAGTDPLYTVTFSIFDQDEEILPDASIAINGITGNPGEYVKQLAPGFYNYEVSKELYFPTTGYFTVSDAPLFLNVVINEIPDVYDNLYLSWNVAPTAATAALRAETYSVWVGTVQSQEQPFNEANYVKVFEETLPTNIPTWTLQSRTVEISQFSEKNIRVAFRHHNSANKDRVVIDNVKITGRETSKNVLDTLLLEDFEGGVPEGFDPEVHETAEYDENWLPAGWQAIDKDDDGLNWAFAMRILQGGYQAHMRSKSFDSQKGALNPDNWLISPMLEMPIVLYHTISFNVRDVNNAPLNLAVVTFDGVTSNPGQFTFRRPMGTYSYSVSLAHYVTVQGTVTVGKENVVTNIVLEKPPVFTVSFTIDMRRAAGFTPGATDVYFTGNFPGWDLAAPGTFPEQKFNPTNNVFFFTRSLQMIGGVYTYKYYMGTGFDNPEPPADLFRTLHVTGNMEITDVFGVGVSMDETVSEGISLFPNPASNRVMLSGSENISSVAVFNTAGQQVYNSRVDDVHHTISLEGFNNGFYMVRAITPRGVKTLKLQVIR